MKKPYTLLAPHTDGKRGQLRVGDTVYVDDADAQWLWERSAIALNGVVKPRVAALLAPKPKPPPQPRCRPCGY